MNKIQSDQQERSHYIRKTAGNVTSALVIRLLRYPFLALYFVFIPRMMGSHQYGQFALFVSVLMLLSEILSFGSPVALGKLFPELLHKNEPEHARKLLWGYLNLWMFVSFLLLIVLAIIIFSGVENQFSSLIIIIFYLSVITEVLSQLFFSVLFGLNEVGKYNLVHLFRTALRFIFLFILYPLFGFTGALAALLITPVISLIYAMITVQKNFTLKYSAPDLKMFRPAFRFGILMFAPTLLFIIQQQSGPLLLKLFKAGNQEIAFFDLANQSFLVLYGLTVTLFETLIPISSKFEVIGLSEKSIGWLTLLLRYIMSLFTLIIFGFYLFGEQLIHFVLGGEYRELYHITVIILLSIPFWSVGQVGYVRSVISGNSKVYISSTLFSSVTYLLCGLILVPLFQGQGLAGAVVMSSVVYSIIMMSNYSDLQKKILRNLKKIVISGFIFIPGLFISNQITAEIFYFGIAGAIFLWILHKAGIIDKQELQLMISFRKTV